jgi:Protein-tyrosine-phosphatase
MAEAILKNALYEINKDICLVHSAGISALVGHNADEKAIHLMSMRGLDISGHRATQLNSQLIRKADLILVMELAHKLEIENYEPSAKGKIFRLGEWSGFDISDPFQADITIFESVLNKIDQGIDEWIKKLYQS